MYELSRIRLYSIGPAGARYADTVLDLRGVGGPVPSPAPAQADFFEEEPTEPPRRPAPAGVLFLENGGGKSVLLKLIFSVMLPGHRNTLGGASSGVLRKFLLADDCGHVALEWQHTRTGETVVVGKVSEWRGRQVSSDPRKFAEAWYSFRPGPGMSLDSLPVAEAASLRPSHEGASTARGRRRTMKGFRDVLTETGKAYPNLDVAWEEVHERWTERLTGLGLDPELFRYQREMNADEGEAAGLFAVKNDSDFTDLLLRAVTDTRDTDGFADLVHGFAHKLGRRAELTAERDFTAGSLDLLRRIADAAQQRERARDIHAGAEGRARTLVRRLAARGRAERGYSAELAEKAAEAERAVGRAEDTRGRSARITAELAYRHASLALKDAEKAAAAQRRELTEARTLHSAWQAAETVLAHRTAADRAARLSAAIREAERDAAPALAARATAAADLVRALHSAAQQAERTAAEEEDRSAALQTASEDAHRDATAAATEAQRARSESGYLRGRLAEVEQETAEAVRAGWIDPGPDGADGSGPDPDPAAAALAAEDAGRTAGAAWEESRETARRAAERAQEANAELSRAELAAARAEDAAQAATTAHAAERRTAATLGAELRLAELLGLPHAGPAGGAGAGVGAGSGADAATGSAHGRTGTAGRGAATRTTAPAADAGGDGDVGDARTTGAAGDDGDAASAPGDAPVAGTEASAPGGGSSAAAQDRSAGPPEGGMAAASVSAGRAAQAGPGAGGPSPSGDAPAAGPGGGPERPAPEAESGPEHAGAEGGASADAPAATAGKAFPASADRSPVVSHKLTPAESPEGWPSAGAPGASATAGPGGSTGPGGSAGHVGSAGPGGPPGPGGSTELGASTGHARSARADSPSPSRDSAAAGPRHDARPGGPHEADASAVPGPRAAAASPARDADDSRARGAEAPFPGGTSGVPGIPAVPEVPGAPGAPGDAALTPEQLDASADALAELLDDAVAACERQLFELRTTAAEDSRMLGALGDGGLLPPSPDVSATVEFLGEHGIPALPGWRYLAQAVDPADHADVLAARPELVDGVVITDPGSHARAREALSGAALLPRSAVAVGTAAALLAPLPRAGGGGTGGTGGTGDEVFLVPPNPAMHDEHAADEERRQLRTRALARDEEIRALAARLAADRALAARLASWRTGCPTGRLAELAAAARESRTAADAARRRLDEARTARASAEEAAADAARARDERQEQAQRARRAADALAGLASRLRERGAWQTRLRTLADEAAQAEDRAEAALARARAGDEDRRAAQRAADDAHRTARALRAERAQIAGVPDDVDETQPPPEGGSLPALREAYRSAAHLYEKVGVGADLRAEQAHAESDESASRAALDRLSNKVRTRAAQLLDGPDGADGPARQAAAARAEARVQMLESRAAAASEQLGRYRGEAERLAPESGEHHTELPEGMEPADAASAQALLRTANAELAAHTDALTEARTAHAALVRAHRAAEEAADAFTDTAALLRDLLREPQQPAPGGQDADDEPEPYPGGPAEARQAAAEARRSLRGCAADLSAAEQAVREASDVLVRHANSARYEQVRTPARQQIRELPAAALPDHAAAWAEAFAPRLRVLSDELDQLERNRDSIVDRLRGLVESSLATLRSAQRLSRLPEGLGEWSGQEFLRIRFDDPDQAALAERLGEVVDEATRTALAKKSDLRRDGMSLLLRGVHAALLPRGVAVEILKPDAVLRAERVPVGQMGDVFSGGQLLTAAIALYCTMAALRGNDRGHDKDRHAGTLFLDNPIGRANATYLLELQRAVADALGVQLLYTTGLFDTTALAEFPLVIRLRNDADLRAGLKYISVEEHLRPGLPQQPPDEEPVHGEITATRMFRRPPPDPSDASPATP